jgi:hypothetical protein
VFDFLNHWSRRHWNCTDSIYTQYRERKVA